MKSILFVLDELLPVRGAPQVRIQNLWSALTEWRRYAIGGRTAPCEEPPGVSLLARPSERAPLSFLVFLCSLGRRAKVLARSLRPDIIVLSVPKYEMLLFAPALKRCTPHLILDFRDSLAFLDYGAYLSHFLPRPLARRLGALLSKINAVLRDRALKAAEVVTVANEGIAQSIEHQRVEVIPNGVDTDTFKPEGKSWFDGSRPLRLVYLGNFAEKDLFDWVALCKGRGDLEVHLIGEGRNRDRVIQQLQGVSVVAHGVVPHEELPRLLLEMDIGFIFRAPGVEHSVPVCLFEYAAMNIPCVCNRAGMMADFVERNELGYVVRDGAELQTLIAEIRRNPASLGRFQQLHQRADQGFSLRSSRERFVALVENLTGGNSSSHSEVKLLN
jgi:glycosyltransferase involved in cell wall biosynthesis